jgi:hypothetical protein
VTTTRKANPQRIGLWLLLIATILLSVWLAVQSDDHASSLEVIEPVQPPPKVSIPEQRSAKHSDENSTVRHEATLWKVANREGQASKPPNLFPVQSWIVAEPTSRVKPAPLPPPTAPNTPFVYMGKIEDGPKGTQIFLMANNKVYAVVEGDLIDATWRFDQENAQQLLFTYLPLNLPQTLSKTMKANTVYAPSNLATRQN